MACFLISAAEAIVVTAVEKHEEKKSAAVDHKTAKANRAAGIPMSRKLKWLGNLLWGGTILLAFEHIWHGEIVPWFPFLTAMSDPTDAAEMLHEMATIGVGMAVLVTVIWIGICVAADAIVKRPAVPVANKEMV